MGSWSAVHSGWGLINTETGRSVNPVDLVSTEKIEMIAWELRNFTVQVIREQLQKEVFSLRLGRASDGSKPNHVLFPKIQNSYCLHI